MRRLLVGFLGTLALFGAGCAGGPKAAKPFAGGPIAEVHVITAPVGLNLDQIPGVDGFSMKLYANNASNPKTVAIESGAIDILMYQGTFYGRTNPPEPAKVWHFEAAELKRQQIETSLGVGYDFVLLWGTNRPTQRLITVQAKYSDPQGRAVFSPPSSVTVLER